MSGRLTRQTRLGYFAFALLLFLGWIVARMVIGQGSEPLIIIDEPSDRTAPIGTEIVHVNTASPYELRRLGFSYYEISQMLYLRSEGFSFDSLPDLYCINHVDSLLLQSVAHRLAFDHDKTTTNVSNRWSHTYDNRSPYPQKEYVRPPKKVALFLADSLEMSMAGMSPQSWDTLSSYQQRFILKGSTTLDTLVTLSPTALAEMLTSHVAGPRRQITSSTNEPKSYPIVELNSATISDLIQLPYIAEKTATAIIEYRDRLGGYVSTEQLKEIYAITPDRYDTFAPYLTADSTRIRKINVNSSNDTRMRRHPYFSSTVVGRLWQIRFEEKNRRLTQPDVQRAIQGQDVNPFFWSYVAYSK